MALPNVVRSVHLPNDIHVDFYSGGDVHLHGNYMATCDYCGQPWCCEDCGDSLAHEDSPWTYLNKLMRRQLTNKAIYGVTSLILALAQAGVDISTPEFAEAVDSAFAAVDVNGV